MLIIKITENELKYFDDLLNNYPDNIFVRTEHGFDMSSSVQITIDLADILGIMIPSIIAGVEMVLLHRIQKRQSDISERETKVHEKELELQKEKYLLDKAKSERNEFEIRISSDGESEMIVKTSDIPSLQENPENLPQIINKLKAALGTKNGIIR